MLIFINLYTICYYVSNQMVWTRLGRKIYRALRMTIISVERFWCKIAIYVECLCLKPNWLSLVHLPVARNILEKFWSIWFKASLNSWRSFIGTICINVLVRLKYTTTLYFVTRRVLWDVFYILKGNILEF